MTEAWLQGPLSSAAYGWRLERRDGVTMGFTSHDHDVVVDGLLHSARPGMEPSSITETMGLEINGLDVRGALTSDAIRADDLHSGRWDNARLSIFLFDWTKPAAAIRPLAIGELGSISHSGDAFEAEFKGPASKLDCAVAPATSPSCRAVFCGNECGLNAERYAHAARVVAISADVVTLQFFAPSSATDFAYGKLRWLDGANCGLWSEIFTGTGATIQLTKVPCFQALAGARVALYEGCNKVITTCANRFGNAVNFRGEPFLPGNDILTRYPGAS